MFGGSQSSGFGQLGNGFGSTSSFGGPLNKPLSSFAAPAVPSIIGAGSKSAKPFGVLGDEDEEDGDASEAEQDVESKAVGADKDQRDERFYEQEGKFHVLAALFRAELISLFQWRLARKTKGQNSKVAGNCT